MLRREHDERFDRETDRKNLLLIDRGIVAVSLARDLQETDPAFDSDEVAKEDVAGTDTLRPAPSVLPKAASLPSSGLKLRPGFARG